jgi:acyl-CoA dehydrogenase
MPTASENIPIIALPFVSSNAKKTLDIVEKFVNEECLPADPVYAAQIGEGASRWGGHPSVIEDLKEKAKKLGLWNMFLAKGHYKEGAGFTNLEYGLIAEQLGKSGTASEVYFEPVLTY